MPLNFTAARSSRISKSSSSAHRKSPFAALHRSKPSTSSDGRSIRGKTDSTDGAGGFISSPTSSNYIFDESLPDIGPSDYVAESNRITNVIQAIQYIQNTMFSPLPTRRAGMNSTKISQVLRFRASLPPIVSVAHVHVLLNEPTKVEREINMLVEERRIRRLLLPGRGDAIHGLGDCLVLVEDWEEMVKNSSLLHEQLKAKFIKALGNDTKTLAVPAGYFSQEETSALIRSGFLVAASSLHHQAPINPPLATMEPESSSSQSQTNRITPGERASTMMLSIPSMGPYLKLLGAARSQILASLKKSRYSEAPLYLIQDRWDGAIESTTSQASASKRSRGEFTGVLPGSTRKWKELYGLNFRWVLEETVGAGLVEIFNTGSVGPGLRSL
ncbi:hypothetical protein FQN57_004642 [Myotisia sp. PD_48]|nr:hypothetical protein FQN57_004642 [Myotisia sp. PD_48]